MDGHFHGDLLLRSLDAIPNNLPVPLTSFVGRRADADAVAELDRSTGFVGRRAAAVAELVSQNRLVSLTGAGGCRKTRLSLEVAAHAGEKYADGVWWVDLARLSEEALLQNTVGTALMIKEPRHS